VQDKTCQATTAWKDSQGRTAREGNPEHSQDRTTRTGLSKLDRSAPKGNLGKDGQGRTARIELQTHDRKFRSILPCWSKNYVYPPPLTKNYILNFSPLATIVF
jgi:hypothetical protein